MELFASLTLDETIPRVFSQFGSPTLLERARRLSSSALCLSLTHMTSVVSLVDQIGPRAV